MLFTAPTTLSSPDRQVDSCPLRLHLLEPPRNPIQLSVFYKSGAGLLKAKPHMGHNAIVPKRQHPIIIAGAHTVRITGFAAHGHAFHFPIAQIRAKANFPQERLANNLPMGNRKLQKKGEALIGPLLIFAGA